MVLIVDPRGAGISGDMILSALVDLGADGDLLINDIQECAQFLPESVINDMSFKKTIRGGIECTELVLDTKDPDSRPAADMLRAIQRSTEHMNLSEAAAEFAHRSITYLIDAESKIHGTTPTSAHLHEAASLDTLVDIMGTATTLDRMGVFTDVIETTPVNVGSGTVTFSHGTFPNPAPATLEILRAANFPIIGSGIDNETATPTGVCILAGMQATPIPYYSQTAITNVGYGAGSREYANCANLLTIAQGEEAGLNQDTIGILETNIDDATGEMLGETISAVMEKGALDASIYTGTGKKGRPTSLVRVLCHPQKIRDITDTMIVYTETLGIRVSTTKRYTVNREMRACNVQIRGKPYSVRYKIHTHHGLQDFKIEFDDITFVARDTGMTITQSERILRRGIEDAR